eukprot:CAMPEP_0183300664 /NCGR_PEP_ID=MMETSP0160_2-20130417/7009_1 /TAXON_ID=2839 ORGANISM="Odontella Sinensis, Strain Grunow 1884" /NCGR_SAMPLE_ID=MMETSP0160_2 /ASSEMBLY_ACC=CAM_ASM_000250 /LENGTH=151 /DNA_ID=CAMNT_0025463123 /DNA_START=583 /DNA_END=1039 /DNA_ORIENTATION=+
MIDTILIEMLGKALLQPNSESLSPKLYPTPLLVLLAFFPEFFDIAADFPVCLVATLALKQTPDRASRGLDAPDQRRRVHGSDIRPTSLSNRSSNSSTQFPRLVQAARRERGIPRSAGLRLRLLRHPVPPGVTEEVIEALSVAGSNKDATGS